MSLLDNALGVFTKIRDFGLDTYYSVGEAVGVNFDGEMQNQQGQSQLNNAVAFESNKTFVDSVMDNKIYLGVGLLALGGLYLAVKGR